MTAVPRVVVSAHSSGHGKSAVAVGLLAAYAARGLAVPWSAAEASLAVGAEPDAAPS